MRDDNVAADITETTRHWTKLARLCGGARRTFASRMKQHLLACAEAVFAERGLDGTSTAMIAERAGLPKANLHYYFPTKLALYGGVLEDLFEDWHRAADTSNAVTIRSKRLADTYARKWSYRAAGL